ncbi:MAG TPA: hypothetical protein VHU89_01495 [Acidobacteriaceae bacterium]|jgi:hypothetical protein|nr:hypothetical protein [Acidobacteriaceae bacterium]
MKINGSEATFHHMGIPTTEPKPGERFSERFGMYTSDSGCKAVRIQWHRFEKNSPLHSLIRTLPHAAFKVADLDASIRGSNVLLGPYEPIADFRVAIIEDGGLPVELIQTTLTDEELWRRAAAFTKSTDAANQ